MALRTGPLVGVIGSSRVGWEERSVPLGRWLASIGVHVVTGGGGGVMEAVSRAFREVCERKGSVIGILPCRSDDVRCRPPDGYPHPHVEIPILTHLPLSGPQGADPLSRNHVVVLSANVLIALPGGAGTLSEIRLAMHYRRPVIAFVGDDQELRGLPLSIPKTNELERVQDFVRSRLGFA